MILAAIDIGSNAARLLITEVVISTTEPQYNKLNLVRVPLRLGFDVFETGIIGADKLTMFTYTMQAFQLIMKAYSVVQYKAYATSAMRDATNGNEVINHIKKVTDINIEIITGDKEAMIVYENHIAENMDNDKSYLYIDVGGGSTECSYFNNGKLVFKKSYNIGTIRLLKNMVQLHEWETMKEEIKNATKDAKEVIAIGSGGNINKVFSLSKKKDGKPLPVELLRDYYKEMSNQTLAQRMNNYGLREDRADVLVPALQIYTNLMRWTNAKEIYVPKIGLADGLIKHLYQEIITA